MIITTQPELKKPNYKRKFAGLIVDMLYDPNKRRNFHTPYSPIGFDAALGNIVKQIEFFRELNIPFAFVRYENTQLNPRLQAVVDETGAGNYSKMKSSALSSRQVNDFLAEVEAETILLSGYSVGVCIRETAIDVVNSGIGVYLAMDALFSEFIISELFSMVEFRKKMVELMESSVKINTFTKTDELLRQIKLEL